MTCRGPRSLLLVLCCLLCAVSPLLSQQTLGRIIGQVRVTKGDAPSHPILVELQLHSSPINSVYADNQGRFGFYNLEANPYHVVINDPAFQPVDELANVNPAIASFNMVQIRLEPKEDTKRDSVGARSKGSNPYLVDTSDYSRYPKSAVKEFDKGIQADRMGKRDDAIRHYQRTLQLSPDFYKAHNNLGSDFLSKSDLASAKKEFEEASRLNQSDAAAYFNLSNVYILLNDLTQSQLYLNEGKQREPESALGSFLEATLDLRAGRLPQAEVLLRKAIELSPIMPQPRLQLVNILLQQGRKEMAMTELQNFVTTFPDGPYTAQAKQTLKKLQAR